MTPIRILVVAALACWCLPASAAEKPNVVFILADDLGYGDLKCYGHPYARTPNLDKLAEQGTRFTQFYVTGVTCCPSRTGFMTGKFPATFKDYPSAHGFGKQITVTELLKQKGYRTGHFGKWHIGPAPKQGTYGIDSINAADEQRSKKNRGRDAHIFDDAIKFIEKNKDGPFYVNVWGHISHFPVNPPQTLVDKFKDVSVKDTDFSEYMRAKFTRVRKEGGNIDDAMRRYLADVGSLDESVGRLLKKLDDLGLSKNTIVVFSSDHGAGLGELPKKVEDLPEAEKKKRMQQQWNMMGYAGEFRGGKHGMYEGGVRVPFIVRWPGHVPEKTVNTKSVISAIDWLPTLCGITGVKFEAKDFDGEAVSSVWLGKDRERTKPLLWKTNNVRSEIAIRDGNWKLHDPNGKKGDIELYDLSTDPGEKTNLAAKHPDVVKQLRAKIATWNGTLPKEYSKDSVSAAEPPAKVLDLANWKLTLPTETHRKGHPDEIHQPTLAAFLDPKHFFVNEGVVFRAECGGTPTKGSKYPRCELRETSGRDVPASWGTADGGTHAMTLRVAVTKSPTVKPHVVCAQIHDAKDDVLMVRLEGKKLLVEGPSQKDVALDANYTLGTKFDLKIEASGGEIRLWHNDVRKLTWKTSRDGCYFKAGCYTQSNVAKGDQPESYGEVEIVKLHVEHGK